MVQLSLLVLSVCGVISISGQEPPQEVSILKQINRVNEDGSYTFGYEAADGSFKIETRDVLGNVKGMFGFIDETGELKRVSYTASNGTGFQASGNIGNSPSDKVVPSSGYTTVRSETSHSDTTSRRPILILRHGNNPTQGPVIQHIPRRTLITTTAQPQTSTTPAYGEYINGRRPHPATEPTPAPVTEVSEVTEPPQTNAAPLKRILVTRRPLDDKTSRGKGGNSLRRQLISEQISRSEDAPDVYSGGEAIPRLVPPQALNPPQAHLLATLNPQLAAVYRNQLLAQNGLRPDPLPPYVQPDYLNPDPLYDPRQTYPSIPLPIDRNRFLQAPAFPQPYPIPGVISTKLRQPASIVEDQEFPAPNSQDRRKLKPNGRIPPPIPVRPIYQEQEDIQPPPSVFTRTNYQTLRDELMDYLLQYLQYRSNRVNPLLLNDYPPQYPSPGYPGYPYPNQLPVGYPNPYFNAGYINPYANPNLIYSRQGFINPNYPYPPLPPFANQNYPLPQNLPFVNPNIQYSQQYYSGQQTIPARRYQPLPSPQQTALQNSVRPTQATTESGDYQLPPADLLRMFISGGMTTPAYDPTRQSPSESYSSTTSTTPRPVQRQKQPVRNIQILGAESKLSAATVKPPEDEMEMQSR